MYIYNEKELRFENKIVLLLYMIIIGLVAAVIVGFILGYYTGKAKSIETLSNLSLIHI